MNKSVLFALLLALVPLSAAAENKASCGGFN
jgi:hypothetical protein